MIEFIQVYKIKLYFLKNTILLEKMQNENCHYIVNSYSYIHKTLSYSTQEME